MSLENLNLPDSVEEEGDVLPGTGSYTLATGIYDMVCKLAYITESSGGATAVNFRFETPDGSQSHRETIYVTSGRAKGQKTYYTTKDGKQRPLPGFTQANELAIVMTGSKLGGLSTEMKKVKLWDYDAQAEVPTDAKVIMDLINKPVKLGIVLKVENKRINAGTQDAPNWVDGPEKREFNEIQKAFNTDGLTSTEILAGNAEPAFLARWEERFPSDYVDDRNWNPAIAEKAAESSEPALPGSSAAADDDVFA